MIEVKGSNKESELKAYCQRWLGFVASRDFEAANNLVDSKNCYGLSWGKKEIIEVIQDYYGEPTEIEIHNYDITECEPNFLVRNDGGLLYDFNLPINGELTDLTVQFEFNPMAKGQFEVVIHDIHVLYSPAHNKCLLFAHFVGWDLRTACSGPKCRRYVSKELEFRK